MGVNKFVLNTSDGEEVKFDLTGDTVTPEALAEGATAHDAAGEPIVGTMPLLLIVHGEYRDGQLYADKTAAEIISAVYTDRRACVFVSGGHLRTFRRTTVVDGKEAPVFSCVYHENVTGANHGLWYEEATVFADGSARVTLTAPARTPNPNALTINGKSYDGSKAVDVDIEAGGPGVLYVHFATEDGVSFTADKTYEEMQAAYSAGQMLYADLGAEVLPMIACMDEIMFGVAIAIGDETAYIMLTVDSYNNATLSMSPITAESNVLVVTVTGHIEGHQYSVSHTSQEIYDAAAVGKMVAVNFNGAIYLPTSIATDASQFRYFYADGSQSGGGPHIGWNNLLTIAGDVATWDEDEVRVRLPALTINGTAYDGSKAVDITIEGGSGGGSTSKYKQPDWGDEDPVVVLPEETYAIEEVQAYIPQQLTLEADQPYLVNYNGTEYRCTAFALEEEGVAIGNTMPLNGDNTGEPFIIAAAPPDQFEELGIGGLIVVLDGSTSVTLSITRQGIVKIPSEYVENKQPPLVVHLIDNDTACDVGSDTIHAAVQEGREVYLATHGGWDSMCPLFSANINYAVFAETLVDSDGNVDMRFWKINKAKVVTKTEETIGAPSTDDLVSAVIAKLPVYGGETE